MISLQDRELNAGFKKQSSAVVALPRRQLKCSNFTGRKKGNRSGRKGKEGKESKGGMEGEETRREK